MQIPNYNFIKKLSENEMTLIIRATRIEDGRSVIVKILNSESPSFEKISKFKREYELMQELQGLSCIPKLVSLEKYKDTWMIIFEDMQGEILESYIQKRTFSINEFVPLAIDLVKALNEIHGKKLIHKDLNPTNILWNINLNLVQIIGFEIATYVNKEEQYPIDIDVNALNGTLSYISPEQTGRMNKTLDYHTDYYSLGVTFYKMLTGKLPFQSNDVMGLIYQHITKLPSSPHELNKNISVSISNIIMKLIAKKSEDRYQSAHGILYDLNRCLKDLKTMGEVMDFPIGKHDISESFLIPENLYGREDELKIMNQIYKNVADGDREIVLVYGESGIGKTSFINEVFKGIVKENGYFIQGKFDEISRSTPFLALRQMLEDFVKQILTEDQESITRWKNKILDAVGMNGQILITLVPIFEKVIGEQPPLLKLDPVQTENRFLYTIKEVINILADRNHPVVIYWDDMQWCDLITLNLLETFLKQANKGYILFVFSYRDNAIDAAHPFKLFLNEIVTYSKINEIKLTPLNLESVSHLLSDTLQKNISEVGRLAEVAISKTDGNPFFLKELLYDLKERNLIYFDAEKEVWSWMITDIEKEEVSFNVIKLILNRLNTLSPNTQKILGIASLIGNPFERNILIRLSELSDAEIETSIKAAINSNYIIPISMVSEEATRIQAYNFSHDKVREACYSLLNDSEKMKTHYQIGHMIKDTTKDIDSKINIIVDHLNNSIEMIKDEKEINELIEMNVKAGIKVKSAQAHEQALAYYEQALKMVKDSLWDQNYSFALLLYSELTAAYAFLAKDEKVALYSEMVLNHAKNSLDKVPVYRSLILLATANGNPNKVLETAISALKELHYKMPMNPKPWHFISAIFKAKILSRKLTPTYIETLPYISDERILAIADILSDSMSSAFRIRPPLFGLFLTHFYILTLKYGLSDVAPLGFAGFGLLNTAKLGNIEKGYYYGTLAYEIAHKYQLKNFFPRSVMVYCAFIKHTKVHYREIRPILREVYKVSLEVGNSEFAILSLLGFAFFTFLMGCNLEEALSEIKKATQYSKQLKQDYSQSLAFMHEQLFLNLINKPINCYQLTGPIYQENEYLPIYERDNNTLALFLLYVIKTIAAYLFEEYEAAYGCVNKIKDIAKQVMTHIHYPTYLFYASLVYISIYPTKGGREKYIIKKTLKGYIKKLKKFADFGPANYLDKYYLVLAEWARMNNDTTKASYYYEQAIKAASENDFTHIEALTKELAAKFHYSLNDERIGNLNLVESYNAYLRWGAKAKIIQLETKYVYLSKTMKETSSAKVADNTYRKNQLDYNSIMKVKSAIANEFNLSKLILNLLPILSENLGAVRCVILVKIGKNLYIEGDYKENEGVSNLMQSVLFDHKCENLPFSIIQYVYNTQTHLVLDAAYKAKDFYKDLYIKNNSINSVLCTPILHQDTLLGILYFENNMLPGVFKQDRLDFLKLISSQIATSIKSARLEHSMGK